VGSSSSRNGGFADFNQPTIIRALENVGASVQSLTRVGHGCPDLLVGYRRRTFLLEVKNPDAGGELNDDQLDWHREWRGQPVVTVETPEEALRAIGALRGPA
jgi:hypothetical protein